MSEPLVSVVTPFHNTAPYLAQCIESVLAQTYTHFEYILVDNCSTDGSGEIAERYARRDPRIKFSRRSAVLPQVANYNAALTEISPASAYCKLVQADDAIFPDCLRLMAQAFEQSERVGLVSSYYLMGYTLLGSGFPFPTPLLPGKEMARIYLRDPIWVFGSPSAVMYRSSLVRARQPFYDESRLHEDTEKCMQILEEWDFGFVHQVLSFLRVDNESIMNRVRTFRHEALDRYIIVQRYASVFLDEREARALRKDARRIYYRVLAEEALRFREAALWKYHRTGLETLGEKLDIPFLGLQIAHESLNMILNPGTAIRHWSRFLQRALGKETKCRAYQAPAIHAEAVPVATKSTRQIESGNA